MISHVCWAIKLVLSKPAKSYGAPRPMPRCMSQHSRPRMWRSQRDRVAKTREAEAFVRPFQ